MRHDHLSAFAIALSLIADGAVAADKPVPAEVGRLIAEVHNAAAHRHIDALSKLMAAEFTSSFGGDGSVPEALAAWKSDPDMLRQLARVTAARCGMHEEYVQCPVNAGVNYRAGFKKTQSGWRMDYFVAGD
ncbi:MAG: hypothetical protein M3Y65_07130 [Pseudomonadota bacterium]|nr:hypothetical protein [Pseudomonadota bacterium]